MVHYVDTPDKKTKPGVTPVAILLRCSKRINKYSSGGIVHLVYILTLQ